jgi:hypothetical protein
MSEAEQCYKQTTYTTLTASFHIFADGLGIACHDPKHITGLRFQNPV